MWYQWWLWSLIFYYQQSCCYHIYISLDLSDLYTWNWIILTWLESSPFSAPQWDSVVLPVATWVRQTHPGRLTSASRVKVGKLNLLPRGFRARWFRFRGPGGACWVGRWTVTHFCVVARRWTELVCTARWTVFKVAPNTRTSAREIATRFWAAPFKQILIKAAHTMFVWSLHQ